MFVIGACWMQDPPRKCLELKAQILTKSDVKTLRFVGVEREDCK